MAMNIVAKTVGLEEQQQAHVIPFKVTCPS